MLIAYCLLLIASCYLRILPTAHSTSVKITLSTIDVISGK